MLDVNNVIVSVLIIVYCRSRPFDCHREPVAYKDLTLLLIWSLVVVGYVWSRVSLAGRHRAIMCPIDECTGGVRVVVRDCMHDGRVLAGTYYTGQYIPGQYP